MNTIETLQEAFKIEGEKRKASQGNSVVPGGAADTLQELPGDNKNKEQNVLQEQQNQPGKTTVPPVDSTRTNGAPSPDQARFSQLVKEQYGVELSDEEIRERLKSPAPATTNQQAQSTPPAGSVTAPVIPKVEDVSDDEVGTLLESNGRSRDLLKKAVEIRNQDDVSIVKQSYVDYLKTTHGVTDQEAEALFAERFFIPPEGKEDSYTEAEIKIGQALLKQEADRIRGQVTTVIDGVKKIIHGNKLAEYEQQQHEREVDDFISRVDRKIVVPIGKSGAKDLGNYPFNVPDAVVNEVAQIMKSPALLVEQFKNGDQFDLSKFYDFLVHYKIRDNLQKSMAVAYHSMGVDQVEQKLHNEPDLTGSSRTSDKAKKTPEELKKEAENYNREQIDKNMSRNKRQ